MENNPRNQLSKTKLLIAFFAFFLSSVAVKAAPVVFWHSDPVKPGETVLIEGSGWNSNARATIVVIPDGKPGDPQVAGTPSAGGRDLIPLQASATSMKVVWPSDVPMGLLALRVQADGEISAPSVLNSPSPWWMQGDWGAEASPGGWLRIFGNCLSFEKKAAVALRQGGKTALMLTPVKQECWSLNLELPKSLASGEYELWVHNGHGGAAGWRKAGSMRVAPHQFPLKNEIFDVTRYGAHPNSGYDDSLAVQKALDAAGKNGGGTVYFPRGRYLLQRTLEIPRHVLLKGAGKDMTQIYWPDRGEPLPALIRGSNSFGIEDLSIMAANHDCGIVSGENKKDGEGNIYLRRLNIDLNAFQHISIHGEHDGGNFINRTWPIRAKSYAILVYGENVQLTDCDVFSSFSPFSIGVRDSLVRNNRFSIGTGCAWPIGGDRLIFEDNEIEGGPMARGTGESGEYWYFARNKVGRMSTHDSEAFTTDGGQREPVKIASVAGTTVTLETKPNWKYVEQMGLNHLYITNGLGAGQMRLMKSHEDLKIELDKPW
ncbi:MAG: glycosyl hydrolase family 28-related protein, partial [Victivallales bacterium]